MKKLYSLFGYWAVVFFLVFAFIVFFATRSFIRGIVLDAKQSELKVELLTINNLLKERLTLEKNSVKLKEDLYKIHNFIPYRHLLVLKQSTDFLYYGDKRLRESLAIDYSSIYQIDELIYDKDIVMARDRGAGYDIRYYLSSLGESPDKERSFFYAMKFEDYYIRLAFSFAAMESTINRIGIFVFFVFLSLFVLFALSNLYFASIITKPLIELKGFVEKFSVNKVKKGSLKFSDIREIALLQSSALELSLELRRQFIELSRRRRQIETVIKYVSEGVLILDGELKITLVNRGVYSLLDIKKEVYSRGLAGRYYYEVIRDNEIISIIEQSSLENRKIKKEIHSYSLNDRVLEISATPLPKGIPGSVVFIDNITEAYRVKKLRGEFVDNVSNELQNPIAAIKENVGILSKDVDSNDTNRMEALSRVLFSINLISNFIRDLNILNKLDETNKDYFRKKLFSVGDVIEDCIEKMSNKAKDSGVKLSSLIENKEIELRGNRELTEIIFYNLIDNSINYTESGGRVNISAPEESNGRFVFLVTDTGIGIPVGKREKIFERFYSVDKAFSQRLGGTGLGLSIVKSAILNHYRGNVVCYDNPAGTGSEFRLSFPKNDISF